MNPHHDPERAEDILQEILAICLKRKCILKAGNGVFYLAKIVSAYPPQATAIAQIQEINPRVALWQPVDESKLGVKP